MDNLTGKTNFMPVSRPENKRRASGLAVLTALMATLALACIALASDATVNKPWREMLRVFDPAGAGRTNCAATRFVTKTWRNRTTVGMAWSFRNYSGDGVYGMRSTPPAAGDYAVLLSYSGVYIGTFFKTVRSLDPDTLYSAEGTRFANMSAADLRRFAAWKNWTGTNSRAWTPTRAARLDNIDAPTSGVASSVWSAGSRTLTASGTLPADVWVHTSRTLTASGPIASDVWASPTRTLTGSGTLPAEVWAHSSRTVTGGNVDTAGSVVGTVTASSVQSPVSITFASTTGIDSRLSARHGSGLWTAEGTVNVLPYQGGTSYEAATQKADVHVFRGDSVSIPYSIGKDLTGWTVFFGAKANPADASFAVPLRDITAHITDAQAGSGIIPLSTSDTAVPCRKYIAELEIRKPGEVNTPLRFHLWVDSDVIR